MAKKNNGGNKYTGADGSIFSGARRRNPNWDYKSQYYGQTEAQREASLKNLEKARQAKKRKKELENMAHAIKEIRQKVSSMSGKDKRDGPIKNLYEWAGIDGNFESLSDVGFEGDSDTAAALGTLITIYTKEKLDEMGIKDIKDLGSLYEEIKKLEAEIDELSEDDLDELLGYLD